MTFDVAQVKAVAGGVLVRFWNGIAPCFVIDHYTVDETAATVTVGLFAGPRQRQRHTWRAPSLRCATSLKSPSMCRSAIARSSTRTRKQLGQRHQR